MIRSARRRAGLAGLALMSLHGLSAQEAAGNYTLRPRDIVDVKVFQEDDLSLRAMVNHDGTVRLPLIGNVRLGGLTTDQAAQRIRAALDDGYLVNPQVTVAVAQFARRRVTVLGQVARPGPVDLRPGERLTLVQAIGDAGGFTRLANPKAVIVKRRAGGRDATYTVNVRQMATDPDAVPFHLTDGDVITVKESIF
jgi:polysaccharide export outer membrane protein